MKLSAVILTKNEQEKIGECMDRLEFCDEIVVVDDRSSDATVQLAEQKGANVHTREMKDDYASQRNFGLKKAQGNWVLFIDADERVSSTLAKEIREFLDQDEAEVNSAELVRRTYFLGKFMKHGEFGETVLTRLGKKGKGKWKRSVHEYWDIKGKRHRFKTKLDHLPDGSLSGVIGKTNKYSTLHAQENLKENKRSSLIKIVFWPPLKFVNNYILKMAVLDGTHGFVSSMLMSFHSFLSWSKLWLSQKKYTQD